EVLNEFYQRIEMEQAQPEPGLLTLASEAHEALLSMMDCLAAGQETQRPEALLERMRTWEFSLTAPDAALSGELSDSPDDLLPLISEDNDASFTLDDIAIADDWSHDPAAADESGASEVMLDDILVSDLPDDSSGVTSVAGLPVLSVADGDDEILEIFLEEAQEISESVETALLRWRDNPEDLLQVAQLQRELHTLKGGARMAEISAVADLCHELETLYENISDGRLSVQPSVFGLLDRAHDELGSQLDAVRGGHEP